MRKPVLTLTALIFCACGSSPPSPPVEALEDELAITVEEDRPLLLVLLEPPDGTPLDHDGHYYRDFIFRHDTSIRDWYAKVSNKRFTWKETKTLTLVDNQSPAFESRAGVSSSDDGNTRERKRARLLAADAGFNFARYDVDGDGTVSSSELGMIVVDQHGAQTGDAGCVSLQGKQVCTRVSLLFENAPYSMFVHELSHQLDPVSHDLYGAAHRCRNDRMTLMSCTGKTTYDGENAAFLDPIHRSRYGWFVRRRWALARDGGTKTVVSYAKRKGAPTPSDAVDILRLDGPNQQALFLEVRDGADRDAVASTGLFVWYAQLDGQMPIEIPTTDPAGGTDGGAFLLPPTKSCNLDPTSDTRGSRRPLEAGKGYRFAFRSESGVVDRSNPETPELYLKVTADGDGYRIDYGENHGAVDGCTIK